MRQFRVGDLVTWCGLIGKVIKTSYEGDEAIEVDFGEEGIKYFTEDGKSKPYYRFSSLKHVLKEKENE